jgi:hypothetical protein
MFEYRVERSSRFPVLVPTGLPSEGAELKPHVVQVDLTEEVQRRIVVRYPNRMAQPPTIIVVLTVVENLLCQRPVEL